MRRLGVLVAVLAAAWLTAPAVAAAASTVSVQLVGAGTVTLEVAAGTPAQTVSCPEQLKLDASDAAAPYPGCSLPFAPVCTPASGQSSCLVRVRATPKVPGVPDIDATEAGGWRVLPWRTGPCAGSSGACLFTVGTCAVGGTCTYSDQTLTAVFDDVRDPTAQIIDGPDAVDDDPQGKAAFFLGSDEYRAHPVSKLTCTLDETVLDKCNTGAASLNGVSDGPHTLEVRATDPSGRTGPAAKWSWTQAYPPVTTFDARPAAATTATDATFAFHADRDATFRCRLDGGDPEDCDGTYDAAGLDDRVHRLEVTAKRTDVDVSSTTALEWKVDTTAPETVITGAPDGDVRARTATFAFGLVQPEPDARFECQLDALGFEPCSAGVTYGPLAPGPHAFQVRAVDAVGNREEPAEEADWNVVVDDDGDGVSPPDDCNDGDPATFPFADDAPGDGVDQDCDGADGFNSGGFGVDADEDGDPAPPDGQDCDDTDPDANSFGFEVPENGVDEDCDGTDATLPGAAVRFKAKWKVGKAGTRLVALQAVKVPAETQLRLKVKCPKGACASRVKKVAVEEDAKPLDLLPYLPGLGPLPKGAVLDVRAFRTGRHPEGEAWTVRGRKAPRAEEFCVRKGKDEAGRC